ncbi:uncharacterized protein LOC127775969 [Oryza glaberrima]|uniref:Uncharacterized protein n=1 Tax=Oryza glaberrima TaxID=4538 RepID=I1Q0M2_ORYGL|nr:uncharacterized protein LOC127775969 [Oryza glaberrima]
MEVMVRPASPPPRHHDFRFDSPAASPYATALSSPRGRLATATFLTAPPSPDPFEAIMAAQQQPETPRLTRANPFDLFQHFSSAPASPRRAAAIYAHFAEGGNGGGRDDGEDEEEEEDDDDEGFRPRASYTVNASSVPFDWEERPGTPKAGLGGGGGGAAWDTDFEFGTVVDKAAPEENLTTADELFEKGKIRPLKAPLPKTADELFDKGKVRPLKPPPGLLDGGSVASSPRSPMSRGGGMWSPRRRSRVGSGVDFDPFAAALLEATKAPSPSPSPLGVAASGSPAKKADQFTTRPASKSAGWRRWRLSDLLLFRSSSEHGRVTKDPIFKSSPARHPDSPVKKASARPTTTPGKANGKADTASKPRKHAGDKNAAAAAEGILGSVRLSPLQRLARGLRGSSWYHGHGGMAKLGTKG